MYGYIYKTTDLTNNKIYIGQKKSQTFLGLKYVGSGLIIKKIIKHCKEQNLDLSERFDVELLAECNSQEELNNQEIYYITKYNSTDSSIGYNIDCGGHTGTMFKGHKHSDETRKKMSDSRKGKNNANYGNHWQQSDELKELHRSLSSGENNPMWKKHHTEEAKAKISNANRGKERSLEFKQHDAEMRLGKTQSAETCQKISQALTGKEFSDEHRKKISEYRKSRIFITDGVVTRSICENELVNFNPDVWHRGRTFNHPRKKDKQI